MLVWGLFAPLSAKIAIFSRLCHFYAHILEGLAYFHVFRGGFISAGNLRQDIFSSRADTGREVVLLHEFDDEYEFAEQSGVVSALTIGEFEAECPDGVGCIGVDLREAVVEQGRVDVARSPFHSLQQIQYQAFVAFV